MRRVCAVLAVMVLWPAVAFCQTGSSGNQPANAIPVRCVNTLGTAFEACGGSGGALGADVNIASVGGTLLGPGGPISVNFTNTSLAVTNTGTFAVQAAQSGTWNIGTVTTLPAITFAAPQHVIVDSATLGTVTVSDGAGALNTIVDSGTLTGITNPVTVTDGAGALNVIVDSATLGTVTVSDGAGAMNVIVDSGTLTAVTAITNALPAGSALIGKVGIDQTTPGTTNRVDVGVFPDNEPFNVAQVNGVTVSTGVGASGTGTQRVAAVIHDGTDTAQVTSTSGGSLQVECTSGCGAAATANLVSVSVPRESVAAPTAATWYLKNQWALPAGAHFTPTRAYSMVTTAGSETFIGIANALGSFNLSSNAFTDGNSVAAPLHYSRLFGCVTTVQSATATTITVTYTDELGNTGNTTAGAVFASASPVGNCMEFVLATTTGQMRDSGVRDITAVSDTAAPTGVVTFYGMTTVLDAHGQALVKEWTDFDAGELAANEQMVILFKQAATTAQLRGAGITGSLR